MKKDFWRFLVVSVGSIIIDYSIYMLLSNYFGITAAKICSTSISCVFAYFANKYFTFKESEQKEKGQIYWYILSQILNIAFNTGITQLIYWLSKNRTIAFVVATIVATIVNYLLQKYMVFNRKNK